MVMFYKLPLQLFKYETAKETKFKTQFEINQQNKK